MYIFIPKDSTRVYAYTKHKDIAKDFYNINSDKFRMIKLSKSDIKEGISIPPVGNIAYYKLIGDNKKVYSVPLTESEYNEVMAEVFHISNIFSYIYNEIVMGNKYGIRPKYLNVINELTCVLKKDYDFNINNINSLKIYQKLFH